MYMGEIFQTYLWNSTRNILPIHWKMCKSWKSENWQAPRLTNLKAFLNCPQTLSITTDVHSKCPFSSVGEFPGVHEAQYFLHRSKGKTVRQAFYQANRIDVEKCFIMFMLSLNSFIVAIFLFWNAVGFSSIWCQLPGCSIGTTDWGWNTMVTVCYDTFKCIFYS